MASHSPPLLLLQAKEEMRSREAQLKNFFANVEVVLRQQAKQGALPARWHVSAAVGKGVLPWLGAKGREPHTNAALNDGASAPHHPRCSLTAVNRVVP